MKITVTDANVKPAQLTILCNAFMDLAEGMKHSLNVKLDNVNVFMEKPPVTLDDIQQELISDEGAEVPVSLSDVQ